MKHGIDKIWERIHSSQAWGGYPTEHVIRFVARNFYNTKQRREDIRILDFGCGQGAHTWYLAREGFDTYAFDGSPSAIEKTKEKLESEDLFATLSVQEAVTLNYPSNFFDAIIDNVCICANRMDDIKQMYSNAYRILKPGGKLFSVCFGEDLFGYETGKEIEYGTYIDIKEGVLVNRGVSHFFSQNEIIETIQKAGFLNISCDWCKYTDRGHLVHQYICNGEKKR